MGDWIDDLERNVKDRETAQLEKDKIRVYKSKIISAKLPIFWKELNEQIDGDCAKIKERLPDKIEYHCRKEEGGANSFRLIPMKDRGPLCVLDVSLNIDGQCINVSEQHIGARYSPREQRIEISAELSENNGLLLRYRHDVYNTAQALSQDLIKRCISNKEMDG